MTFWFLEGLLGPPPNNSGEIAIVQPYGGLVSLSVFQQYPCAQWICHYMKTKHGVIYHTDSPRSVFNIVALGDNRAWGSSDHFTDEHKRSCRGVFDLLETGMSSIVFRKQVILYFSRHVGTSDDGQSLILQPIELPFAANLNEVVDATIPSSEKRNEFFHNWITLKS